MTLSVSANSTEPCILSFEFPNIVEPAITSDSRLAGPTAETLAPNAATPATDTTPWKVVSFCTEAISEKTTRLFTETVIPTVAEPVNERSPPMDVSRPISTSPEEAMLHLTERPDSVTTESYTDNELPMEASLVTETLPSVKTDPVTPILSCPVIIPTTSIFRSQQVSAANVASSSTAIAEPTDRQLPNRVNDATDKELVAMSSSPSSQTPCKRLCPSTEILPPTCESDRSEIVSPTNSRFRTDNDDPMRIDSWADACAPNKAAPEMLPASPTTDPSVTLREHPSLTNSLTDKLLAMQTSPEIDIDCEPSTIPRTTNPQSKAVYPTTESSSSSMVNSSTLNTDPHVTSENTERVDPKRTMDRTDREEDNICESLREATAPDTDPVTESVWTTASV